jgi:hypothetical protein
LTLCLARGYCLPQRSQGGSGPSIRRTGGEHHGSTYAREIQTPAFGYGLDGVPRGRAAELRGILNGIDTEEWGSVV